MRIRESGRQTGRLLEFRDSFGLLAASEALARGMDQDHGSAEPALLGAVNSADA